MADLFSDLVGEVLGASPQITPLLPPRFAPWPELPVGAEPPPPAQMETGAPAANSDGYRGGLPSGLQSDLPVGSQDGSQNGLQGDSQVGLRHGFPLPLVDPSQPAAQTPLLTFRQMAALQPRPEPSFQPGQEQAAHLPPEAAGFEPGQAPQDPGQSEHPGLTPRSLDPIRPAVVIQTFPAGSAPIPPPVSGSAEPQAMPDAQLPPDRASASATGYPAAENLATAPKEADSPFFQPARGGFLVAAALSTARKRKNLATILVSKNRRDIKPQSEPTPAVGPGQPLFLAAPAVDAARPQPAAEATPQPAHPEWVSPRSENIRQPPSLAPRDSEPFTTQTIPDKGQAGPVETGRTSIEIQPIEKQSIEETTGGVEARLAPAAQPPVFISSQGKPVENLEQPLEPAQMTAKGEAQPSKPHEAGYAPNPRQPADAQGQALLAETRLVPSAPQKDRDMPRQRQPERMALLPAPVQLPPAQVENLVQPIPQRSGDAPKLLSGRAVASPALAPAENLPAQGKLTTRAARTSEPVQPATQTDSSGAPPAALAPRAAAAPMRAAGAREPVSPTRLALSTEREPEILPVPESAQGGKRQADALTYAKSQPPLAARPPVDQPEQALAPTIHVTIGRVVVRASLPAGESPPKRVDLPRPLLSLESYLKGKKGGEA